MNKEINEENFETKKDKIECDQKKHQLLFNVRRPKIVKSKLITRKDRE